MSQSTKHFTERAHDLLKEFQRSPDMIPSFNDDAVRRIIEEINVIHNENVTDHNSSERPTPWLTFYRHSAMQCNKRCLLAYLYQRMERIKSLRWEYGPIMPTDIKQSLCEPEVTFFNNYSTSLASYMRSIGDGYGIDLTTNLLPPKSRFILVRCLSDYGDFELEDGEVVQLKKNSQHYLPVAEVESLVRQGILEHIGTS